MNEQHWQGVLIAIVGIWLAMSWVLIFTLPETASATFGTIVANSMISGLVAFAVGGFAIIYVNWWQQLAAVAIALWLIASPWLLGFSEVTLATSNFAVCGIAVFFCAAWSLYDEWHSLSDGH